MILQVLSLADCRRESALLEHRSRGLLSTTKLGHRLCPQGIVAVLTKARQHLNPMAHGVLSLMPHSRRDVCIVAGIPQCQTLQQKACVQAGWTVGAVCLMASWQIRAPWTSFNSDVCRHRCATDHC